jgi:hypothetical protein
VDKIAAKIVALRYRETHGHVLALVEDLSDEQLAWRPHSNTTSIGFNLWHLARWADHLQAALSRWSPAVQQRLGARQQIWETDELAVRWGLDTHPLGFVETGMDMDLDVAGRLPFPSRDALLDYSRRAFAAAERTVNAIDDQLFLEPEQQPNEVSQELAPEARTTAGEAITSHLMHAGRHLGMIECLRGQLGLRGTATR